MRDLCFQVPKSIKKILLCWDMIFCGTKGQIQQQIVKKTIKTTHIYSFINVTNAYDSDFFME
jgi:hypothetical protein